MQYCLIPAIDSLYRNLNRLILGIILFFISYPRTWSLYLLGSWLFLNFILWMKNPEKNANDFLSKLWILLPLVFYFFIQLANIFLRRDDLKNIETQLMFFLVPFLGSPFFNMKDFKNNINKIFKFYIYGLFSVSVILLMIAIICFIKFYNIENNFFENFKSNVRCFFYVDFSRFEHPTYLSMKVIWALLLIAFFMYRSMRKLLVGFTFFLFTVIIFLLASKAGIIILTIIILWLLFSYINKKIRKDFFRYLIFLFITSAIFISAFRIAREISRINIFINQLKSGFSQSEVNWKNLDQRTREWYCAIQLIKEKPIFGHGIEKVEDRMVEEYLKNRWVEEASLRYNAHNQFLETQMTYGIPGTLSLLWMLFTPIIFRKRLMYPKLATAFVLMMTFFLMFESMFVRQWGIMFFTLFYCILLIPSKELEAVPLNYTALKNQ